MSVSKDNIQGNSNKNDSSKPVNPVLSTMKQLMEGEVEHPALKPLQDETRQRIWYGDIQWPDLPELKRFKHIKADTQDANEVVIRQFIEIAEATTYILMHLGRWIEEEISGDILLWYKNVTNPFSYRIIPIIQPSEDLIFRVLPGRLPASLQHFRDKYEALKEMASEADSARIRDFAKSIKDFKFAAHHFYEIILPIHSEAMLKLEDAQKEKREGGQGERITKDEANVRVRQLLKKTPTWKWSTRKLAKQVHCGHVLISKTPAYIAYNQKREELRCKKTIDTVSLSDELEAVLGEGEKDEVLKQLIAEQEGEQREDARQARLYLSRQKKGKRSRK